MGLMEATIVPYTSTPCALTNILYLPLRFRQGTTDHCIGLYVVLHCFVRQRSFIVCSFNYSIHTLYVVCNIAVIIVSIFILIYALVYTLGR